MHEPGCVIPENPEWCAYTHHRPDGSVFYIGKGSVRRAKCLAPSRRSAHHNNVVRKYGRENIAIKVIPAMSEFEAIMLERALIAAHKFMGSRIVNLTDGGEGRSGYVMSDVALGKHIEASRRGWEHRWRKPKWKRAYVQRDVSCTGCGTLFQAKNLSASFCSKACNQKFLRRNRRKDVVSAYRSNRSGVKGVYFDKKSGKWSAMITAGRQIFLGLFLDKADAVAARKAAEVDFAEQWNGGRGVRASKLVEDTPATQPL